LPFALSCDFAFPDGLFYCITAREASMIGIAP